MKAIKKISNYKYISIILVVISIIVSIIYEVSIGNINYYRNDFKGIKEIDNYYGYQENDDYVVIIDDEEKYINELELNVNVLNPLNIDFKIYYLDSSNELKEISEETLYVAYQGNVAYKINQRTKELKLVFNDCNKDMLKIKNVSWTNKWQFNYLRMLLVFTIIYLILDFIKIIFQSKPIELWIIFLKIALFIGILLSLYIPLYYSVDEKEHMIRAYNISNNNFILVKDERTLWPRDLQKQIDLADKVLIPTTFTSFKNNFQYLDLLSQNNYEYMVHNSTASPYLFCAYVFSGIGIKIAKLFNLSFPYQFYLGRIFNAIMYAVVVALAIKLSKKTAKLIFVLGLLPAVLFQGSSFSADVMTNAFTLLAIGLTFYYRDRKEKIGIKELLGLMIVYILSFASKIAYFPITLLIWLIPKKRFKKEKWVTLTKIGFTVLGVIFFLFATNYANNMGIVQWVNEGVNDKEQLKYIISNPINYLITIFNTLQIYAIDYFSGAVSLLGYCGALGSLDFLLMVFIVIVALVSSKELKISKKDRLIFFLIFGSSLGASLSAIYISYNPVGSNVIDGYQGRYIVPLLLPFIMLFVTDNLKFHVSEKKVNLLLISLLILLNIHMMLFIFSKYYL